MTTTQTLILTTLALAAILTVSISGCDASDESAEAAPTKKQYISKADAICEKQGSEQFKEGVRYYKKHPGTEEEDLVKPVLLPPLEKQLQELQDLPRPNGDEADLAAFFTAFEKALTEVREEPASAVSDRGNPFEQTIKLGEAYGFADCRVLP